MTKMIVANEAGPSMRKDTVTIVLLGESPADGSAPGSALGRRAEAATHNAPLLWDSR